MMLRAALFMLLGGCGAPTASSPNPPSAPVATFVLRAHRGVLAAGETGALWPDRVRIEGGAFVFEADCGCNYILHCTASDATNVAIAITLSVDTSHPMCDDCFPMTPARCALPPRHATTMVAINGRAAFELPIDAGDGSLWDHGP